MLLSFILLLHTVRSPGRCLLYTFTGRYNNLLLYRDLSQYDGKQARGITVRKCFWSWQISGSAWKELEERMKNGKRFCAEMKAIKKWFMILGVFFVGRKFSFYLCCSSVLLFFYNRNIIFRQKFFDPQMWISIHGKESLIYHTY